MIRVVLIINRLEDQGGAEVSTLAMLDELQGERFEFCVVTLFGEARFREKEALVERGAQFLVAPPGYLRQLRFVDRVLRSWRPDVVHSTLFDSDLIARIVGPFRRVPVVSSLVNTEFSEQAFANARSPRRLRAVQLLSIVTGRLGVSHFHAITQATASHGMHRLRIAPERITVVPRGRDPLRLGCRSDDRMASVRSALEISDSALLVLNVARREPQKGQLHLIDSFERVHREIPDSCLLIAGREGSMSAVLLRRVEELGLAQNVRFLGSRDDVADLMAASDIFVLSSLWEGLGGVLIEALALELPIVAFDIAAASEVVGEIGTLVPIGSTAALADGILEVARCPEDARDRAARGRERFESHYSTHAMCQGMGDLYEMMSELRPPPLLLNSRSRRETGRR